MNIRGVVLSSLLLGAVAASLPAAAHDRGHRPRVGVYFGYSWFGPPPFYYPPYPYYYYPPTVVVRPEPQIYIERAAPQAAPRSEAVWYYCRASGSYYPYVKECPGGWEQVVPTPPPN